MKAIKMIGLAALMALMATASVGASSAIAESTSLCSSDGAVCSAVTHVHEESVGKAKLLTSLGTTECNVLFLGDVTATGSPLKIKGEFTYSNCELGGGSCTAAEENGPAELEVLKEGHETAKVTGKRLFHVTCGSTLNCAYTGTGLTGTAKGPLLSEQVPDNGEVSLSKQALTKEAGSGFICPKINELDITTSPLTATYLSGASLKMVCLKLKERTGLYLSSGDGQTCSSDSAERVGFYELAEVLSGINSGEMACGAVEKSGFFLESGNGSECQAEDSERKGAFELGTVS